MKRLLTFFAVILATASMSKAQTCWTIRPDKAITMKIDSSTLPYSDHMEMSGEQMSFVLRWSLDSEGRYSQERSLVFPMLRTIPNNTHASLMYRMKTDIISLVGVNSLVPQQISTKEVTINGALKEVSDYAVGKANIGGAKGNNLKPTVEVSATMFPSTTLPMMCELYEIRNISDKPIIVSIPEYHQIVTTLAEKGVDGSYIIRGDIFGSGTYELKPEETLEFQTAFQAYCANTGKMIVPDVKSEYAKRMRFISESIDSSLILETPENAINTEFRFAKIRACESIYRTKGGLMHGPGGESYYAALWCNDECEYVCPFYPYIGYQTGNESALNCYTLYSRYQNDEFRRIPSSIIAEGIDIWDGAGDRGDAAMITHGASRYILARGDKAEAAKLWPFIKWCLEYCNRQLNDAGVPKSDSDELEGRFPSGSANLSTACLYYDGLVSATYLAPLMGEPSSVTARYKKQAAALRKAIGEYFSANVSGYDTYRYYDGNDLLRSWVCLPLCFGIEDRADGTLAALFSPKMMTEDGILTQQGSETFWDRSTLYALRGAFYAGRVDEAEKQLLNYSDRRLLSTHVPYPIEAWPEGSQRHLSAEGGLYCRIITEGLFGIRPTGFKAFTMKAQMPSGWDHMALRHVKSFGGDFDVEVTRPSAGKIEVKITNAGKSKTYDVKEGSTINVSL